MQRFMQSYLFVNTDENYDIINWDYWYCIQSQLENPLSVITSTDDFKWGLDSWMSITGY